MNTLTAPQQTDFGADDVATIRLLAGMTQQQLAQHLGCSAMSVIRWEQGRTTPLPVYEEKMRELRQTVLAMDPDESFKRVLKLGKVV